MNNKHNAPIVLNGENIREIGNFTYLGSIVCKNGGADDDVKSPTNKARHVFNTLRQIWNSNALSINTKTGIFYTNVKSVLLYGSETWNVTKTNNNKLEYFVIKCIRHILNIRWPGTISNKRLGKKTNQIPIYINIKRKKWGWIGHTLRKSTEKEEDGDI